MLRLKPIVGASYTVKFTDRGESDVNKILRGVLYIVFGLLVLVSLLFLAVVLSEIPSSNYPLTNVLPLVMLLSVLSGSICLIVWLATRRGNFLKYGAVLLILGVVLSPINPAITKVNRYIVSSDIMPRRSIANQTVPGLDLETTLVQESAVTRSAWDLFELTEMNHLNGEVTYYTSLDWDSSEDGLEQGLRYFVGKETLDANILISYHQSMRTMELDIYRPAEAKTLFQQAIKSTGIDQESVKERVDFEISGVPAVALEYAQQVGELQLDLVSYLFFSRTTLYVITISAPSPSIEELRGFGQQFVADIKLDDGAKPLLISEKVELAKQGGEQVVYADYARFRREDNLLKNEYFVATGLVSNLANYYGGAQSFDLIERSDTGFVSTTGLRVSGELDFDGPGYYLNEGDGVKIIGFMNAQSKPSIYAIEKTQIDFGAEDIIASYKKRCVTYDYRTVARDPHVYEGELARFTGKVVQVMESGRSVILLVNVTKDNSSYRDTVYVTYTRKSDQESRVLVDDIVTMYGTLAGLKSYETILGSTATIPALVAEYIDVH